MLMLLFLIHNVKPDMGIVLCLSPSETETAWSSSFDIDFLVFWCCSWMTLHSPIRFDFVFCVGMTSVQSSLILMFIFLLIDHLQFGMKHFFVSLSKRDWNCVCKQFQFKLWFGLFDFIFGWTQSNPFAIDLSFCCKF